MWCQQCKILHGHVLKQQQTEYALDSMCLMMHFIWHVWIARFHNTGIALYILGRFANFPPNPCARMSTLPIAWTLNIPLIVFEGCQPSIFVLWVLCWTGAPANGLFCVRGVLSVATIFDLRQCEMKAFVITFVCYPVFSLFFLIYFIAYIRVSSMLRKLGLPKATAARMHELDRLLLLCQVRLAFANCFGCFWGGRWNRVLLSILTS